VVCILSNERDDDPGGAFARYRDYIAAERERFPPGALALATSDWYYGADDHRAPHDSWLLSATLEEVGRGERNEDRAVSLRLRLLGAYHDLELEVFYPLVRSYSFGHGLLESSHGHGDWRYDEFRISENGRLIHEIEWDHPDGQGTWLIEADDVAFSVKQVSAG
jgi:hypothetical protein